MSDEIPIGPNRCIKCGGEYGEHAEDCRSLAPAPGSATCLNPMCRSKPYARGLCLKCYKAARNLVVRKRTTWEDLKAAGKCFWERKPRTNERIDWLLQSPNDQAQARPEKPQR